MNDEPDPEQDRSVTERLDARHYGDPDDHRPAAPPCSECGEREAVDERRQLCSECAEEDKDDV